MHREITRRRLGTVGADFGQPDRIGIEHRAAVVVEALVDEVGERIGDRSAGQREEHPAAFLVAVDQPRIGKDLDVARHARLALAEHLRELADRQFHRPQQRDDAQPRRIGKRLEQVGQGKPVGHAGQHGSKI